jgi:hypothetical protein
MRRRVRRMAPAAVLVASIAATIGLLTLLLGPIAWRLGGHTLADLHGKDRADAINSARQTLLAAAGGTAALTGLAFTARSFYLSRRGQLTDRYTKAIGLLASDNLLAYDFPGATVHPTGILTAAQIRDADWKTAPPQIRTRLGEPFLDTWFDPEDQPTTVNRLREAGLSDEEVVGIRQRRTPLMHACNFDSMLWEWVNLGLFDLLNAATGPPRDGQHPSHPRRPRRSTPGPGGPQRHR